MKVYFEEKDLVSFGEYLLSEKRKQRFQLSYDESIRCGINNPISVEESLKLIHHADIENWKSEYGCTSNLL